MLKCLLGIYTEIVSCLVLWQFDTIGLFKRRKSQWRKSLHKIQLMQNVLSYGPWCQPRPGGPRFCKKSRLSGEEKNQLAAPFCGFCMNSCIQVHILFEFLSWLQWWAVLLRKYKLNLKSLWSCCFITAIVTLTEMSDIAGS